MSDIWFTAYSGSDRFKLPIGCLPRYPALWRDVGGEGAQRIRLGVVRPSEQDVNRMCDYRALYRSTCMFEPHVFLQAESPFIVCIVPS